MALDEKYVDPSREGLRVEIAEDLYRKGEPGEKKMTAEVLLEFCRRDQGYTNPELNDQLYLQYKGFVRIENLEPYMNLRCLYLDCNGITKIENLKHLVLLKSLYLQSNCIQTVENLPPNLIVLNLSQNRIAKIESGCLDELLELEQINLSRNNIVDVAGLEGLAGLATQPNAKLASIDLSVNYIDEEDPLVEFFDERFTNLDCLFLQGNPSVRRIKNYRRRLISQIKNLKFLDTKQVAFVERIGVNGWVAGGAESEQNAKKEFYLKEIEKKKRDFEQFRKLQALSQKKLQRQLARQAREKETKTDFAVGADLPEGYVERLARRADLNDWVLVDPPPEQQVKIDTETPCKQEIVKSAEDAGCTASAENATERSTSSSQQDGTHSTGIVPGSVLSSENLDKLPFAKMDPVRLDLTGGVEVKDEDLGEVAAGRASGASNRDSFCTARSSVDSCDVSKDLINADQESRFATPNGKDGADRDDNITSRRNSTSTAQDNSISSPQLPNFSSSENQPLVHNAVSSQVSSSSSNAGGSSVQEGYSQESTQADNILGGRDASFVSSSGRSHDGGRPAPSEVATEWYWSKLRDERLDRLAAQSRLNFGKVAEKLQAEFNSAGLTEQMVRERYRVVLRGGAMTTVPEEEEATNEEFDVDAWRDQTDSRKWWMRKLNNIPQKRRLPNQPVSNTAQQNRTAAQSSTSMDDIIMDDIEDNSDAASSILIQNGRDLDEVSVSDITSQTSSSCINPGLYLRNFEKFAAGAPIGAPPVQSQQGGVQKDPESSSKAAHSEQEDDMPALTRMTIEELDDDEGSPFLEINTLDSKKSSSENKAAGTGINLSSVKLVAGGGVPSPSVSKESRPIYVPANGLEELD